MAIDSMENEENIREEMGDLFPHLPPKQTDMPSPEYFEAMPEKILQRWRDENRKEHHRHLMIRRWMAVAAISLGLMVGVWWLVRPSQVPSSTPEIALSSQEAYQYVMENIGDFEGLMEQQIQWPTEEKINLPESSAAEQYLLEEYQGKDIEQIF